MFELKSLLKWFLEILFFAVYFLPAMLLLILACAVQGMLWMYQAGGDPLLGFEIGAGVGVIVAFVLSWIISSTIPSA